MGRPRITPDQALENFFKRFEVLASGCWEWTAGRNGAGYGYHYDGERSHRAHRYAYKIAVDPSLPDDLTLDHLCRNRACVNPDHLEPVTVAENILRSEGVSAVNARKTRCVNGHEFTQENTRIDSKTGHRGCRTCLNSNWQRHTGARKANANKRVPCPDCGLEMNKSSVNKHKARYHKEEVGDAFAARGAQ